MKHEKSLRLSGRLLAMSGISAGILMSLGTLWALSSSDEVPFPNGFRDWLLVYSAVVTNDNPLFDQLGGMRLVHVNAKGLQTMKEGGPFPYPDGTIVADDVHHFSVEAGRYVEGAKKAVTVMLSSVHLLAQAERKVTLMEYPTSYRTIQIDGLSIFFREAGPKDAPVLLLLGLPSSSRMFEPLFARLSGRYHLVAPDYPGFGHSDWPDPKKFAYTFDRYAEIVNRFVEALGLSSYTLYMQDYGGPVGFRMALAHPERVEALIVQDAVAHNEGLAANWKARRAFWADRAANENALRTNLLSLSTTRTRHVGDDPNVERYDPDLWTDEFAFLSQPGQADIQSDLFYDYRTNVEAYPKWQAWMRENQPRLLVIWGKHDLSFDLSEPEAYRRDVPKARVHVLDAGHFALDTAADQIAGLVRDFVSSLRWRLEE